ncbi:MAG: hypothetical protein ABEI75_00730 [Halobaculum sp.]
MKILVCGDQSSVRDWGTEVASSLDNLFQTPDGLADGRGIDQFFDDSEPLGRAPSATDPDDSTAGIVFYSPAGASDVTAHLPTTTHVIAVTEAQDDAEFVECVELADAHDAPLTHHIVTDPPGSDRVKTVDKRFLQLRVFADAADNPDKHRQRKRKIVERIVDDLVDDL